MSGSGLGATYRLQFNRDFTFRDAAALADYLADLGVTDVYASPLFAARPGSTHGYDVVDFARLNPELGSEADFDGMIARFRDHGLGLVLDVVPNHMSTQAPANRWWTDVLKHGPASRFAGHFDIDFAPAKTDLAGRILLPILDQPFGVALEDGGVRVELADSAFHACTDGHRLPLSPATWPEILNGCRDADPRLRAIAGGLERLRPPADADKLPEFRERTADLERDFARLLRERPSIAARLREELRVLNGAAGDPRSFDRLERLLEAQPYRLSSWRVAADEINYRRFFDINDLVSIRAEEPEVFRAVHGGVLDRVGRGDLSGLRIDHIDGLSYPARYLAELQRECRARTGRERFPIVVEKILSHGERLPPAWTVDGTTGYDFLNALNGIFVKPAGWRRLRDAFADAASRPEPAAEVLYDSRKVALLNSMAGELHMLALRLDRLSERHRSTRDFTRNALEKALAEVVACFPVYRTYVEGPDVPVRPEDRAAIQSAIASAKWRNRATSASVFEFIESVLLLEAPAGAPEPERAVRFDFVRRFQQLTGPVMAKGLEDTAFYRRFPLASLCEVGADFQRDPPSLDEFHRLNRRGSKSLLATTTHDTKRAEDARARLNVLSEIPGRWLDRVASWRRMNRELRSTLDGRPAPDRGDEYFLYQTLAASFPGADALRDYPARLAGYLEKALREAKLHTSWVSPHPAYETACRRFLDRLLAPGGPFLDSLSEFLRELERPALSNVLAQALLKATAPGVPDVYQGSEFVDLRLADPDNRRRPDFEARRRVLGELQRGAVPGFEAPDALKLDVLRRALRWRRDHAEVYGSADYAPLQAAGPDRARIVGFARGPYLTIAARWLAADPPLWEENRVLAPAAVEQDAWRDLLRGGTARAVRRDGRRWIEAADVFRVLPVALLVPA
jgi:(1->4)-alpha-D-glucan 1-alpha-D-glucosylmutase